MPTGIPSAASCTTGELTVGRILSRPRANTIRAVFNASVVVYDPYKDKILDILTFPGITGNPALHIGGVGFDPYTGLLSIVVDAAAAFITAGADVSGNNLLMKYDPTRKELLWTANLTAVTKGKYGGFQDVAHDCRGNTYVVGTYPSSILRVDKRGRTIVPWYPPATNVTTLGGYTGISAVGDTMLAADINGGPAADTTVYRFDLTKDHGTPKVVPRTPATQINLADAIHFPPKYDGKVLLVAEDLAGVTVLKSNDGWKTARNVGRIVNNQTMYPGSLIPAAYQIGGGNGQKLYMMELFFTGDIVPGTNAGNRSDWPMVDITAQVDAFVSGH